MRALRIAHTEHLTDGDLESIRRLLEEAFADDGEGFTVEDWAHATGGTHVLAEHDGLVLAHAAIVERELHIDGRPLRTGYVEAVATLPEEQRRGHGRRVMEAVGGHIREHYQLGALSTGSPGFYANLGWEPWLGPTGVRTDTGAKRTPDEDGGIMVLRTPSSPALDRTALITCPWRPGDVW